MCFGALPLTSKIWIDDKNFDGLHSQYLPLAHGEVRGTAFGENVGAVKVI